MTGMDLSTARIEWTDGARRRAEPRRGGALNPKKPSARMRTGTPRAFREGLLAALQTFAAWLLRPGILTDTLREEHRAVARAMRDDWVTAHDGPFALEHEALALYWWSSHWYHPADPHTKLADGWIATEGPAFALRAPLRARARFAELYPDRVDPRDGAHATDKQVAVARAFEARRGRWRKRLGVDEEYLARHPAPRA
jgi:hypothetical protein